MQLKKFEAPTIQEALRRIKAELGDDAVIFDLHTRCARDRAGQRTGGTWVEVTAAIERSAGMSTGPAGADRTAGAPAEAPPAACGTAAPPPAAFGTAAGRLQWESDDASLPWAATSCSPCLQNMLLSGFTHAAAGYLIGEAAAEFAAGSSDASFKAALQRKIASHLPVAGPIVVAPGQKKKAAFVGATGVGKTTTLAKIAAQFACRRGMKVRIITLDTYRIAAAEQLKIYGRIMNVPVAVAASAENLDRELQRCDDANLVLIDTAGRNYRDTAQMAALGGWLARYPDIETHLLLCATTTADVLSATVRCFARSSVSRVIITKVDESVRPGHLYETLAGTGVPISYITNGQRVPEDILPATETLLSELLLHGYRGQERTAAA